MSEIAAAIQGFKLLWDKIQATKELSDSTAILVAVNDVQQKLIAANNAAIASQDKVLELETKLREIEDWNTQIQRYELFKFPTSAFAHKLKQANDEPMHYLCSACVNNKKKSILQPAPDRRCLQCSECKAVIEIEPHPNNRRHDPVSWKVT